jgi:uncharacterized protein (DUF1800 family)
MAPGIRRVVLQTHRWPIERQPGDATPGRCRMVPQRSHPRWIISHFASFLAEVDARFNGTMRDPVIGFPERLTMFWSNHFAVAVSKGPQLRVLAGAFEREAIRPHVFGRFEEMLLAVETHPAMLAFLDN